HDTEHGRGLVPARRGPVFGDLVHAGGNINVGCGEFGAVNDAPFECLIQFLPGHGDLVATQALKHLALFETGQSQALAFQIFQVANGAVGPEARLVVGDAVGKINHAELAVDFVEDVKAVPLLNPVDVVHGVEQTGVGTQ